MLDTTPILVGSGQYVDREPPSLTNSLSPADMAAETAGRALRDCGANDGFAATIDVLAVARLFEHSVRDRVMWPNPYGCSNNMPRSVAKRLNIDPRRAIYAEVGGETPQRLVNQMAESIHAGEVRSALLTGAEALATIRHGVRAGLEFDWHEEQDGDFEDLWPDMVMSLPYEVRHGVALPIHVYALFDQARRHQMGLSLDGYREQIGQLFAAFSDVAASNPYAQFPYQRDAREIATPSAENYLLCEPYTKWMVAQDAVNQGAAVVLTSVGIAREFGIDEKHWIYLSAYADVDELPVVQRADLARSAAQSLAVKRVMTDGNVDLRALDLIDLYSCFPIAVSGAAESLGISGVPTRALTLTGGLPFFGGPGNNYSLHGIAEVVRQLRGRERGLGLVAANGGYLSKHSVGLYSRTLSEPWQTRSSQAEQLQMDNAERPPVLEVVNGNAIIESYAAVYARGKPAGGFIIGRTHEQDARCIALVEADDAEALEVLFQPDAIGRTVAISHRDEHNYFRAA